MNIRREGKDFPSLPTSKDVPPSEWTETLLREEIFKPAYKNLPDYLTGFMYTGACMQTKENCERKTKLC